MKILIPVCLTALIIAGCTKQNDVKPSKTVSATTKTTPDTTVKSTTPHTAITLSHDDSTHLASYNAKPQTVNLAISDKTVTVKFNENVDILFSAEGYKKTSAVHLTEDFKNTQFYGFDFTTVAEGGNTTFNWADDNLNNVILKSVSDTTINGRKMVKINVHRTFTFFKVFATALEASNEKSLLAKKVDDKVAYTSYTYYNQKNYPAKSVTAKVVYSE